MFKQVMRPKKMSLRRKFFSQVRKPAKTYLCLPSTSFACITDAISCGAIDQSTRIVAVEKEKSLTAEIEDKLKVLFGKNYIFHKMELSRTIIKEEIDLAYIDLCGQINPDVLTWLTSVEFSSEALVAFTFSKTPRSCNNTFYQRLLNDKFSLYGETQFTNGAQPTKHTQCIAEAISFFIPFRWNITEEYNDTKSKMIFLGAYLGKSPGFRVRTEYFNFEKFEPLEESEEKMLVNATQKVVQRIQELAQKGVERPQQIGGLRIMYNKLSPAQKAWVRRKAAKEMEKIAFN